VELKTLTGGRFGLVFSTGAMNRVRSPQAADPPPVAEDQPFRYPAELRTQRLQQNWLQFPVSGISRDQAEAYLAWLRQTLPGARLCTEYEWERAARGADDRLYPHGDRLSKDDANIDVTYDRKGFGPDEAGSHPATDSPFGVSDLVGNVNEWVLSVRNSDESVIRPPAWYYGAKTNRIDNREMVERGMQNLVTGMRVCASFTVRR
jgi:formylglycine-generating enzyme required for sulfatase activity